ncbi:MAG: N-acetylmuramoyl-L-alanine amidase [Faecousia sp.]
MIEKGKRGSVLLFYVMVVSLFLFGTFLGNQTVATISEMIPVERLHRIVIDAGHGGEDGGAVSCSGKNESNFNLQIALRMNDLLHLLGYDTVMIRSTDTSVYTSGQTISQKKVSDLKQRVRIVERTNNALLLSIHQNTFPEEKYSGAQVFYAKTAGSEELAKLLQDDLVSTLNPGSSRKAKQGSGIYLLDKISATGVLVECGFLSNQEEEAKLRTPDYQKQLCCVISTGLARFLASDG